MRTIKELFMTYYNVFQNELSKMGEPYKEKDIDKALLRSREILNNKISPILSDSEFKKVLQATSRSITDVFEVGQIEDIKDPGFMLFSEEFNVESVIKYASSDIFFAGVVPVYDIEIRYTSHADTIYNTYMEHINFAYDIDINKEDFIVDECIEVHIDKNYKSKLSKLKHGERAVVGYISYHTANSYRHSRICVVSGSNDVYVEYIRSKGDNMIIETVMHDTDRVCDIYLENVRRNTVDADTAFNKSGADPNVIPLTDYSNAILYSTWYCVMMLMVNPVIKHEYVDSVRQKSFVDSIRDCTPKKSNKRFGTDIIRHYSLDDMVDKVTESHKNNRHCMLWHVAGHWRHYKKSGKSVFIQPFWKGALRESKKEKHIEPNVRVLDK